MRGRFSFIFSAALVAFCVAVPAVADDHGHHHGRGDRSDAVVVTAPVRVGALAVRDVQVRDVVVSPPVVTAIPSVRPRPDAMPRPSLPDVISRPQQSRYARPVTTTPGRGRRAYYVFSPRVSAGFGLLVGYPVAYPYPYVYPFTYDPAPYGSSSASLSMAAPPGNTYSNVGTLMPGPPSALSLDCGVDPGASVQCGGVSFDVAPADAQVSVEGVFVGTVESFSPTRPPLVLAPGVHYVEVRMPGYRTAVFEVTIGAGEVTPYQGALEPLRTR